MSALSDQLAAVTSNLADVTAGVTGVATAVAALDAKIVAFNNSPGSLSPADQKAVDDIQTASSALVAQVKAIPTAVP